MYHLKCFVVFVFALVALSVGAVEQVKSQRDERPFNPFQLSYQTQYPLLFKAVQKYIVNREEGLVELRKLLKNDPMYSIRAMQTLIYFSDELLRGKYPEVKKSELTSKEDPKISFPYGLILYEKRKYNEVIPALIAETEHLSTSASIFLWGVYYNGLPHVASPYDKRIFDLFKKLSDEGLPRYQYFTGTIYSGGYGVPQNLKTAENLLVRSKLPEAKVELGKIYQFERKDYKRAKNFYLQAIDEKHLEAYEDLATLELENKNFDSSFKYFQKTNIAFPENSKIITNLAYMYFFGLGTKPSCQKGLELLRLAADRYENPEAQFMFYSAYKAPKSDVEFSCIEKSVDLALSYLKRAAKQGHEGAIRETERLMNTAI